MAAQVTVIVGPARSGKTQHLLQRYRDALRGQQSTPAPTDCLWLAPSHGMAAELRDSVIADQGDAYLAPSIHTFAGYAERVVAASSRPVRPISRLQKRSLLRRIVEDALTENELSLLAPVALTPGFIAQLDQWIAELKRQDLWAEDVSKRAERPLDRELALLYRRYQRRLLQGELYDAEGRFWAAREILEQNVPQRPLEDALVVVDGFSDFTTAQLDILRLLAERSAEMQISLDADPECLEQADAAAGRALLFRRARETAERLRQFLPTLRITTTSPGESDLAALRHAERNLFRDDAMPASEKASPQELEIVAASGPQNEIEEIARRIKADLIAGQARPQDYLVVFPNLTESARRVADVFDDFGIPHWIEIRLRLASSPLVRTALSVLRLGLEDWPFRRLVEVVGNRLLTIFDQTAGAEMRALLERAVRAAQLPQGKDRLLQQLRKWSADSAPDRQERAQQATAAVVSLSHLAAACDRLPEHVAISEWSQRLEQLLIELGVSFGKSDVEHWRALSQALLSIEIVAGGRIGESSAVDLRQFLELIESVADELRLPGAIDPVGRVRVLTAESARHTSAPHVFLAGLSEQAYSRATRADQWEAITDSRSDESDAMYLFYALVTRATRSLTLTYAALDDKGQQLPPSPLVVELQHCFGAAGVPETRVPLGHAISSEMEPLSRSTHRQFAVAKALAKDQSFLAGLLSQPARAGAGIVDAIVCISSRARRHQFGPFEGLLEHEAAQQVLSRRFDANHLWSPSQLEGYAACPFRFFAENLLGLEPLDDLTLAGDAARRGSLLHHVLAAIHAQLLEQPAESADDEAWQRDLAERFARALDARIEATPLGGLEQALREIERRQIAAWAQGYAQQEADYRRRWGQLEEPPRPAHVEVRFGPDVSSEETSLKRSASTPRPFELDLGEERIRITGQIDRIDVGRVGGITVLNVIDYKSGKQVQLKDEHMHAGRQLQLPLYALAAEELLFADKSARALTAGYWSIQGSGFEKKPLEMRQAAGQELVESESWSQLRPNLLATVRQLVTGIRAGQFPVYNEDQNCTRWCPHSRICRVRQIRNLEKVWPPPEAPAP